MGARSLEKWGDVIMADILKILKGYRTRYSFNDGDGVELIDKLCPDDAEDVTDGKLELEALAEYLYDELPAVSGDGWTYCDDRLPEEEGNYIVTYYFDTVSNVAPTYGVCPVYWKNDLWWFEDGGEAFDLCVIAWRPLPEPAKGRDAVERCSRCGSSVCHPLCDCWKCQ